MRDTGKSEWIGRKDSDACDEPTKEELDGLHMSARNSVRDGAVGGASDPVVEGNAAPGERSEAWSARGPREGPEFVPDVATADGGLGVSGGIAGGADPGAPAQEQTDHDSARRREE